MRNDCIKGYMVKVLHGSNASRRVFEQEFNSRNHFSNYMDILPDNHWRTFEIGGPLKIIDRKEADYKIYNSDEFIIIQVCDHDPILGEIGNRKKFIVEGVPEYLNVLSEYDQLSFYEISNQEGSTNEEIDLCEDHFDEIF